MKKILITGAAPCAIADIERVPVYFEYDFMAIGLDAVDKYAWPIKYVATYHPTEIDKIRERRKAIGGNLDYKMVGHESMPGIDIVEPYRPPSGSSALLGALVAIKLKYDVIILCGCPIDVAPYLPFQQGWIKLESEVKGKVYSMSGWTMKFLGAPVFEGEQNG